MDKVGCSDGIYLPSIELSNFEGVSIIFEVSIIPVQFEVEEITFYVTPRARSIIPSMPNFCVKDLYGREQEEQDAGPVKTLK
jgi:hypothetical protein